MYDTIGSGVVPLLLGTIVLLGLVSCSSKEDGRRHEAPEEIGLVDGNELLRDLAVVQARTGQALNVGHVRLLDSGIFLVETGTQAIYHFDHAWEYIQTFGSQGEGPGEFASTWDLFHRGDTLYVVDSALKRITAYLLSPEASLLETSSFADGWINSIQSVEVVNEEHVLLSGRGPTYFEDLVEGAESPCAVFLARNAELFEQERCMAEYPPHLLAGETGSVVIRDNRVFMRKGVSGYWYVWFTHAPDILRIDPEDFSVENVEIDNPLYSAPRHVHYSDVSSGSDLNRWRSEFYSVWRVAETGDHLTVQYTSRDADSLEPHTVLLIADGHTEETLAMLRLDDPSLRLFDAVEPHKLLLVQFEENDTILATVDVRELVASAAD